MSIYNDIYIGGSDELRGIVVNCQPDQFQKDMVKLDKDDYVAIRHLAQELDWDDE